jgi:hypothetical protein
MRNTILLLAVSTLLLAAPDNQAADMPGSEPGQKLSKYIRHISSQKVYLHFNKSHYQAGEVMWFNAYLLNSVTHLPDTSRSNIYVDLINSDGVIMERRLLLSENGISEGDISLPLTLPDGNYRLRAYTGWMRNFGEEFFYNRYFYIANNKYGDMIPRSDVRTNRRFNRNLNQKAQNHDIAFFPEGGDMVQGVNNRVAFKAVNALGRGLEAEGVILDERGIEISRFSTIHSGMGSFEILPEAGSSYHAMVSFTGSRPEKFNLPQARHNGVALRVERENENIILNLQSGLSPGEQGFISEIMILAHTRGVVQFDKLVDFSGEASIIMPEKLFPSGITQITVFSGNNVPLAERLVFIQRDEGVMFNPRIFRAEHEGEKFVGMQMEITDFQGNPAEGNFSMSILDGSFTPSGSAGNIMSNILITSDLAGIIENPGFYLDHREDRITELDHLMMTHGWRRFAWENVLAEELPPIDYLPSSTLSLRGRITDPAQGNTVNRHPVRIRLPDNNNDTYTTRSDRSGYFTFDSLVYYNNFKVEIGSNRLLGDYPPKIDLLTDDIRGHEYTPNFLTAEMQITRRGGAWKRVSGAGRSPYAILPRASRTAPRQFGVPDQTIYIDRDKVTHRTVYDVLVERAQGLNIYGNTMMFRGPNRMEPMFMLDGIQTSRDVVLNLNPRDTERIELYRGTSTAIFGVRGSAGVIIAYQRAPGNTGFEDTREFVMVGYHAPREFYSDVIIPTSGAGTGEPAGSAIHWEPRMVGGLEKDKTVMIPVSGTSGNIKIIIEGIDALGVPGAGIFTLEIK